MDARKHARDTMQTCVVLGAILGVIGGIVMVAAWPGEEVGAFTVEETGNAVLAVIGGLAAWAGNVLMFVGLIAYGVRLGREASPESKSG